MDAKYILVKANRETREEATVDGPREKPFTEEANALNADYHNLVWKHMLGEIKDGKFYPEKKFSKEVTG